MEKRKIDFKGKVDIRRAASILEEVLKSLKEGTMCFQHGEEVAVIRPSEPISVEIEASSKKGKEKYSVEMSWQHEVEVTEEVQQEIIISSSEPEVAAAPAEVGNEISGEAKINSSKPSSSDKKDKKGEDPNKEK